MTDQPGTSTTETTTTNPPVEDADAGPLERADESIREARDAEGGVAANDDITSLDEQREGDASENPDGEAGHP